MQSRIDEAIECFEKARTVNSGYHVPHAYLASAYALKGDTERATGELAEARRLSDGRWSSITSLKAAVYFGLPNVLALFETALFAGLRKAGMPEE